MNKHDAILKIYPNVVTIRGDVAYDADGKEVTCDNDAVEELMQKEAYKELRAREYPPFTDYIDGIVKGDNAQVQAYIDACLAVKNKYPKGVA